MTEQALSHVKILDLSHYMAGPYCTKLAAGFGADVVKIERPKTGDRLRQAGPFANDEEGLERSIPFLWLNTGKKSVTLNLKAKKAAEIIETLVRDADVLVENFAPGVMAGLGLDYTLLREINPGLVMIAISNYGQTGPYRDYQAEEIQAYAMGGGMYMTGDSKRPPLAAGPAVSQYTAGLYAYTAILLALFQREMTGEGQYVDVSIMDVGLEQIEDKLTHYLQNGKPAKRGGHMFSPWGLYPCEDGYAAITGAPFRRWTRGAEIFDEPRLLEDRLRHARDRAEHRTEVDALMQPWLSRRGKEEVRRAGLEQGMAFGFLATFDEVLDSPQHEARGFFEEMDHPVVGKHTYCGAPFKLSETPWESGRAPRLGEHNRLVYREALAYSEQEIDRLGEEGVT